jgi:hypothetical protein
VTRPDISVPSKNVIHDKSLQSGATPSLQTYTEQRMAAAYTNSTLGEKECSRLMHKDPRISSMSILRTALPLLSVIRRQQADPNFFTDRGDVYRASIEGSYILLRVFIEFSAWNQRDMTKTRACSVHTKHKTRDQKRARDTDVMLDCFELPLATPNDFDPHQDLVARVYDRLSKPTAHFTYIEQTISSMPEKSSFLRSDLCYGYSNAGFSILCRKYPRFHADLPQTRS